MNEVKEEFIEMGYHETKALERALNRLVNDSRYPDNFRLLGQMYKEVEKVLISISHAKVRVRVL